MLYFLALLSLSTSANLAKLNQMPPEILGFWRLTIATALLVLYQLLKKNFQTLTLNHKTKWIFISGFFFFLHLWTYKYAAKHTLIANTMVLFATNPIWASLGGLIYFHEKIGRRVYVAYFVAFLGIVYLVGSNLKFAPEYTLGNASALISALFYAAYMLSGKKARQSFSNQVYSTYQFMTCAVFFLLASLLSNHSFIEGYTSISWLAVMGLVILPTFLGHFILNHLVNSINLAVLSCGKLIEPILASIMAYFIFQESLTSSFYVPFALTSVSVMILFWPQIKNFLKRTVYP
ncbi:MAG: DMT family transporter [Moraxellaceae bacterium]|nr:DMT family transporter [Pseudobdellovibrionaceae bacterium]